MTDMVIRGSAENRRGPARREDGAARSRVPGVAVGMLLALSFALPAACSPEPPPQEMCRPDCPPKRLPQPLY